jgi:hypothetical protein
MEEETTFLKTIEEDIPWIVTDDETRQRNIAVVS